MREESVATGQWLPCLVTMRSALAGLLVWSVACCVVAEPAVQAEGQAQGQAQGQAEADAKTACSASPACKFEDLGNGVLKQLPTGRQWTQSDNGAGVDWKQAKRWCESKGKGWELPTVAELQALYDGSLPRDKKGNNVSPLFRLSNNWFWSGETSSSGLFSSEAWFVLLSHGIQASGDTSSRYGLRALCVRRS